MQLDAAEAAHPGTVFDKQRKVWRAATAEDESGEAVQPGATNELEGSEP
jgi:hypothetical protein